MSTLFVLKVGGRVLAENGAATRPLSQWIAATLAAGDRVCLVHGGGALVDQRLAQLGLKSQRIDGIRVTPAEHMAVIAGVLAGEVNAALSASLVASGVPAVGLSLLSAGAECEAIDHASFGRVGRVFGGPCSPLTAMLEAGLVPVVSSIGADNAGDLLNVNADDAAAGIASALNADVLKLVSDVPAVLDPHGNPINSVDAVHAEELISAGIIQGGMAAKIRAAIAATPHVGRTVVCGAEALRTDTNPPCSGTVVTAPGSLSSSHQPARPVAASA